MLDLLIRGGTIVDGTGSAPFTADIGITDGRIETIGLNRQAARRTIDADGLTVTPGFVDIHTHFDGQALWDDRLDPSFSNGVTTAILGNCGVGFAPVRKGTEDILIDLMDGVEEIPGSALSEGLDWDWTSFPDYLNRLEQRPHSFNIGALMTHGPLRFYVLGEDKIRNRTPATPNEVETMRTLVAEGLAAGAWGLSSTRTPVHHARSGAMTPDYDVGFEELYALATEVGRSRAIFGVAPEGLVGENHDALKREMRWYERIALETGARVHLLMQQAPNYPDFWQEQLGIIHRARSAGALFYGQTHGRGIGVLLGLTNTNPFQTRPNVRKVIELSPNERMKAFADCDVRRQILSEADEWPVGATDMMKLMFQQSYAFTHAGDFEPGPEQRLTTIAEREGRSLDEVAYDHMVRDGFVLAPVLNYGNGDLEIARRLFTDPACVIAASDAGAHCQTVCDGALPTFMLTHWVRDRTRGERLPVEQVVELLTSRPARSFGMTDRGVLREGLAADINVIDLERLEIERPQVVYDLPSGAPRLVQSASGYAATIVGGTITRIQDEDSGERPGVLLRRRNSV